MLIPLLFVVLMLTVSHTSAAPPGSFDLTLQWGDSYCRELQSCFGKRRPDVFTIHGLWGTADPQKPPPCADSFKEDSLAEIRAQLETYWLNVSTYDTNSRGEKKRGNRAFWEHEWNRHGCFSGMKQLEYFKVGLTAYNKVKATIKDLGCKPGKGGFCIPGEARGVYPQIKCTRAKGIPQIQELVFSVGRDGTPNVKKVIPSINCPGNGKQIVTLPSWKDDA